MGQHMAKVTAWENRRYEGARSAQEELSEMDSNGTIIFYDDNLG